jgi:hypothetical protein
MHEFSRGEEVQPFRAGDLLPGDIESHEVGVLCPDETALRIPLEAGVLAVADGVVRDRPLTFVPDFLLGDDPEGVKQGLKAAYARLLSLEFDHLICAHRPWIGGAKQALREFVSG